MIESNVETNTPAPFEHVVSTEFDGGEGVLVDLNTKHYYQLNETAMLVWRALEKGKKRDEIIGDIVAQYDVTDDHASASVEKVIQKFRSYKLISGAN